MAENMSSHGTMTDNNHAALWHGRFAEGPDAAAVEFETSIHVDERMALDDIAGSKAHAAMLSRQDIISAEENDTEELPAVSEELVRQMSEYLTQQEFLKWAYPDYQYAQPTAPP